VPTRTKKRHYIKTGTATKTQQGTAMRELINKLRKIKSFPGCIPDQWASTYYMKDRDIEKELLNRYNQFLRLETLRGCGELTKNEKSELSLLKEYFNDED